MFWVHTQDTLTIVDWVLFYGFAYSFSLPFSPPSSFPLFLEHEVECEELEALVECICINKNTTLKFICS